MKLSYESFSATGKVRKNNEDHLHLDEANGVFAVADGMGGGAEGERASAMVCDALGAAARDGHAGRVTLPEKAFSEHVDAVGAAIAKANQDIFEYAGQRGFKQMGSTIALLMFEGGESKRAAICHIGDSRVYRVRGGAAELLTRDHTVGAELEKALGEETARGGTRALPTGGFAKRSNPLAHLLTRAIGTEKVVKCEWRKIDVEIGDTYLICSDGVHDVIETDELAGLLTVEQLSAKVLERGAPDNYSFIIIRVV